MDDIFIAFEGGVRQGSNVEPAEVEITEAQYQEAISAITSGREVTIDGGFAVRDLRPSHHHVWEDGVWVDHTPDEPALDLVAYAAQKRWEKEVGGVDVGGMVVHTDDRSKSLVMGARLAAQLDPAFTTDWKAADGSFVTVDAATIIAISDAVLAHVAICFAIEAQVGTAIGSGAITSTTDVDAAFA